MENDIERTLRIDKVSRKMAELLSQEELLEHAASLIFDDLVKDKICDVELEELEQEYSDEEIESLDRYQRNGFASKGEYINYVMGDSLKPTTRNSFSNE
jgi:hypothetical protein